MSETEPTASPDDALVDELQRAYEETQAQATSLKRTQSMLSIGLVGVFVVALVMLYSRTTSMYAPGEFEPHLVGAQEELAPDVQREARILIDEVYPVYADAAKERLAAVKPKLEELAREELDGMVERMQSAAEARVRETLGRVERRAVAQLNESFPGIDEARKRDEVEERFTAEMETQTVEALGRFNNLVMVDMETLNSTIEGFRPNRFEGLDKNHLVRAWMHHWLMLADYEVMYSQKVTDPIPLVPSIGGTDG